LPPSLACPGQGRCHVGSAPTGTWTGMTMAPAEA
jgi:hypothetical protein